MATLPIVHVGKLIVNIINASQIDDNLRNENVNTNLTSLNQVKKKEELSSS